MPNWVSKAGVWEAATEHAVLPHLSGTKDEVYDGKDRAAQLDLASVHGVDEEGKPKKNTLGMDFRHDPEVINRARTMGFKSAEEYAIAMGWQAEQSAKEDKEKEKVIVKHEAPKRKPGSKALGGGKDLSGQGKDRYGGFGDVPD